MTADIAIATITLARNSVEEQRLRAGLAVLSRYGMPLFVTDGGSSAEFVRWLSGLPNVELQPTAKGLVPQVKSSVAAAIVRAPWVFYTEPDKVEFFTHGVPEFLALPGAPAAPPMLLPSRDAASFATFPKGQQAAEQAFNELAAVMLGTEESDTLYGPLLVNRECLSRLTEVPDDAGWGWRIYIYAWARRANLPVRLHVSSYPCPEEQRGEDTARDRAYRLQQLNQNVRALEQVLRSS